MSSPYVPPATNKLQRIVTYDDLNGEECAQVLAARHWQFMQQIPEFQRRFALTRVVMRVEIALEIHGATPPRKVFHDSLEINVANPVPQDFTRTVTEVQKSDVVDAFNNPPDQVREDHSLALPRAQRSQAGVLETVPVLLDGMKPQFPPAPTPDQLPLPPGSTPVPREAIRPNPAVQASPTTSNVIMGHRQRTPFAAVVELDHGSIQRGERGTQRVIGDEKFAEHTQTHVGGADVSVQFDFANSPDRTGVELSDAELRARAARDAKGGGQ